MIHVKPLRLEGLLLIRPRRFADERGYFLEEYRQSAYSEEGISIPFVQDNISFSHYGVLRGLHYQEFPGQAKLISVIQGKILDVAVDIRPASPTFGEWEALELSEENHIQFFIPIGFAHGYCTLSDTAHISYKVSSVYDPATEKTIAWDDPDLNIPWPILHPILSARDRSASPLKLSGVR